MGNDSLTRYSEITEKTNGKSCCYADRINIMVENTTKVKPCASVIDIFVKTLYPMYKDDERIDIHLNNTDFGVG